MILLHKKCVLGPDSVPGLASWSFRETRDHSEATVVIGCGRGSHWAYPGGKGEGRLLLKPLLCHLRALGLNPSVPPFFLCQWGMTVLP